MIRNIFKYYKKEIFTCWFLCLLPFAFLTEILVYVFTTPGRDMSVDLFLKLLGCIALITGIILAVYQAVSNIRFLKDLKKLNPEIKETLCEEIKQRIKRGRYLLTKDVLIYYGIFSKKVYKRREISRWKRNEGIYTQHAPKAGTISVPYDNTIIFFKSGYGYMDMIEYPIDPLESENETKGELPYDGILALFISLIFLMCMIFYPRIMEIKAGGTEIERFLYYASYEVSYFLVSVIITVVSGVFGFIIRCIVKPKKLKKNKLEIRNKLTVSGILLTVTAMFFAGMIGTWYKDSVPVREDLNAYHSGDLCVVEGEYKERGACERNEVGWTLYNLADRKSFEPILLSGPGDRLLLLRSAFDELPSKGKGYTVKYLGNTKIIVSFSEK